jgi:hypothetical protein
LHERDGVSEPHRHAPVERGLGHCRARRSRTSKACSRPCGDRATNRLDQAESRIDQAVRSATVGLSGVPRGPVSSAERPESSLARPSFGSHSTAAPFVTKGSP